MNEYEYDETQRALSYAKIMSSCLERGSYLDEAENSDLSQYHSQLRTESKRRKE